MSPMEDLLLHACDEIRQLRRQNEILSAKVEVMELFGLVFRTQPNYGERGMTEDIVWKMEQTIEQIRRDIKAKAAMAA